MPRAAMADMSGKRMSSGRSCRCLRNETRPLDCVGPRRPVTMTRSTCERRALYGRPPRGFRFEPGSRPRASSASRCRAFRRSRAPGSPPADPPADAAPPAVRRRATPSRSARPPPRPSPAPAMRRWARLRTVLSREFRVGNRRYRRAPARGDGAGEVTEPQGVLFSISMKMLSFSVPQGRSFGVARGVGLGNGAALRRRRTNGSTGQSIPCRGGFPPGRAVPGDFKEALR